MSEDDDFPLNREDDGKAKAETTRRRKKREEKEEAERKERLEKAYREVMDTPSGRLVMWDMLSTFGLLDSPFVPGAQDLTYFNLGRHNEAIKLLAKLNELAPDASKLMHKENV